MKDKKPKRPPIPPNVRLKLWVVSGGRCQFPGCNQLLIHEKLTLSPGNYSNIAHIISWTPTGPRGDIVLSPKFAQNISNLMLMCQDHADMIDLEENREVYTVELLRKFKEDHENRIAIQTSIDVSRKTTVVRLQTNIRGRLVAIPQSDVYTALITAGRYPDDPKGIHVDLTNLHYSAEKSSWQTAAQQIDHQVNIALAHGNDEKKKQHFSIFSIAPIPILAYLGFKLGNTISADIYIKLREKPWCITSSTPRLGFTVTRPTIGEKSQNVALSIAISGTTSRNEIAEHIDQSSPFYEITIQKPQLDQIQCLQDLESFRSIYRETLDEIRQVHGKDCVVHLFGAMPACAAIVCGREIIPGVDPTIVLYEHSGDGTGFINALTIN